MNTPAPVHTFEARNARWIIERIRSYGVLNVRIGPNDRSAPNGLRATIDLTADDARALAAVLVAQADALDAREGE